MRYRRRHSHVVAALLATIAACALPARALAATSPPAYTGTYGANAQGVSESGAKKSSPVTIWVRNIGGKTRFTFRVDSIGITFEAEGVPSGVGTDTIVVPVPLSGPGIDGNATLTMTRKGAGWVISGKGSGKALGKNGTGRLGGSMTATGVDIPSLGTQVTDMVSSLFGGPPDTNQKAIAISAKPPTVVEPAPSYAPATPRPPQTDVELLEVIGLMLAVLVLAALFRSPVLIDEVLNEGVGFQPVMNEHRPDVPEVFPEPAERR